MDLRFAGCILLARTERCHDRIFTKKMEQEVTAGVHLDMEFGCKELGCTFGRRSASAFL